MPAITGAEMRTMLEEIVGKVTKDWDERLARIWERQQHSNQEYLELKQRVYRLEKIVERMGKAALQEKP
jgi:hypothetical protein